MGRQYPWVGAMSSRIPISDRADNISLPGKWCSHVHTLRVGSIGIVTYTDPLKWGRCSFSLVMSCS